jgi:hypothetical protein
MSFAAMAHLADFLFIFSNMLECVKVRFFHTMEAYSSSGVANLFGCGHLEGHFNSKRAECKKM